MAPLSSAEVVEITRRTNFGTWRYQKSWNPMHIVDAKDCTITDGAGKEYLDFSSQLMCSNLGHKNPAVIASIAKQAEDLAYAMPGYATTCRAELSELLLEVLPKGLSHFFYTTSGDGCERGGVQNCADVYGKIEDYFALQELSRFDFWLDCGDRRPAPVGNGAGGRQAAGRDLCAGGELLPVPDTAYVPGLRDCVCGLHRAHDSQ